MAGQRKQPVARKRNTLAPVAKVQDYKQVFGSQAGERVLNDLIDFCGIIKILPSNDTNQEFTAKGMRNVVKYILAKLQTNERELMERLEAIEQNRKGEGRA